MQKDILKDNMIKKSLENFIPLKRSYVLRLRDNRPFKTITNELSIANNPLHRLKVQIGTRLIETIKEELGVK